MIAQQKLLLVLPRLVKLHFAVQIVLTKLLSERVFEFPSTECFRLGDIHFLAYQLLIERYSCHSRRPKLALYFLHDANLNLELSSVV